MMEHAQALKHSGCNTVAGPELSPEKALIFRITHVMNVPWILKHGIHCQSSTCLDPNFVPIGNSDLIGKRHDRPVNSPLGGDLCDYIPFYFTPHSPMLLNIKTGRNGVTMRPMREIAILTTSLHKLHAEGLAYTFTDRHAFVQGVDFLTDLADIGRIDWPLIQSRNFQRDSRDPDKMVRYMAEALVLKHLPVSSLMGVVCYGDDVVASLQKEASNLRVSVPFAARPGWYF